MVPDFEPSASSEPDLLLSPEGLLVHHLTALARCRSPKEYMAAHADCPFFPASHPAPVPVLEEQVRSALLQDFCRYASLLGGSWRPASLSD